MKIVKINKLLLVIIVAFVLRMVNLNQSLWLDEAISASVAKSFTIPGIIFKFVYSDTHPPLYYVILKLWTSVFGFSEVSMRFPSVVFAVATVYVIYLLGNKFGKKVGLYAASLMAVNPLHIYYSQEVRMYSLTVLLVCLSALFIFEKKWVKFSISILFLGMTDYLPLIIMIPFAAYVFLTDGYLSHRLKFLYSTIPLASFLLVWFPVLKSQLLSTNMFLAKFPNWGIVLGSGSPKELMLVWIKFIIGRVSFGDKKLYALVAFFISLLFIYLIYKPLREYKKNLFLWLWYLMPIVIYYISSFKIHGFSYFRLIYCLPAFLALVAVGIKASNKSKILLTATLSASLIFAVAYLIIPKFQREDWKHAVTFVEDRLKPGEVVAFSYFEPVTPYLWYSSQKDRAFSFENVQFSDLSGIYTFDYLMDLTDQSRLNYMKLASLGFFQTEVYNFNGVGQIRYWTKVYENSN